MAQFAEPKNIQRLAGDIFDAYMAARLQNDHATAKELWCIWVKLPLGECPDTALKTDGPGCPRGD